MEVPAYMVGVSTLPDTIKQLANSHFRLMPNAIGLWQGESITVFFGGAIVEFFDHVNHQRVSGKVTLIVINRPVDIKQP